VNDQFVATSMSAKSLPPDNAYSDSSCGPRRPRHEVEGLRQHLPHLVRGLGQEPAHLPLARQVDRQSPPESRAAWSPASNAGSAAKAAYCSGVMSPSMSSAVRKPAAFSRPTPAST
jgi:hypothetical protein